MLLFPCTMLRPRPIGAYDIRACGRVGVGGGGMPMNQSHRAVHGRGAWLMPGLYRYTGADETL